MKKFAFLFCTSVIALALSVQVQAQQRITVTVAGSGENGYSGDNGPAKKAALSRPSDVCIDAAHNVYFTDQSGGRIRKLNAANGTISTIAGGGTLAVDGIAATTALVMAGDLCCDAAGNVYFVAEGTRIRRIDAATNIITTIAGGGTASGDGIPATTAMLTGISGVCIDAGHLYFLEGLRIHKVDLATGNMTAIAGSGSSGYTGDGGPALAATMHAPAYMAMDPWGNIYFGDQGTGPTGGMGSVIRRIDAATGIITTVIGGGGTLFGCTGGHCMIGGLSGLCCDGDGDVIFNEWSCSCRAWNHTTDWVTSVGGNFSMESFRNDTISDYAWMNNNYGICADEAGNIYIGDKMNDRIRKIMLLTHEPVFAFGQAQTQYFCGVPPYSLDAALWVADMDFADLITWTVVTPPSSGILGGFPASVLSAAIYQTSKPVGLSYTPSASFSGIDSFRIQVSDGTHTSTVKMYVRAMPGATVAGPTNVCVGSAVSLTPSLSGGVWSTYAYHTSVSSGTVTGVSYGADTVYYSVHNGCGDVETIAHSINVDTVMDPGAISGLETVCEGADITLSDPVPAGAWTSGSGNATVSTTGLVHGTHPGIDVIFYTVSNTCGTFFATKDIVVNPLPHAGIIDGPGEVCKGNSAIFTTTGDLTGSWAVSNANATVSGGVVNGLTSGTVVLLFSSSNECGYDETNKLLSITDCELTTPVVVAEGAPTVDVFPNPATTELNLVPSASAAGAGVVTLTDVTGRVVLRTGMDLGLGTKHLDLSAFAGGAYMLSISAEDLHFITKVVIAR